jgi:methylated-DNA-[protein]-cysteine S-methyltransferase
MPADAEVVTSPAVTRHDHDMVLDTPIGRIGVQLAEDCVVRVDFVPGSVATKPAASAAGKCVAREFERYFGDATRRFSVPVAVTATPFQRRVWQELLEIPAGETRTYGELARHLDSGARAVGNACRCNPVPVIVPCHRVIGANGIGGYAGHDGGRFLARKRWLLTHEQVLPPALKSA